MMSPARKHLALAVIATSLVGLGAFLFFRGERVSETGQALDAPTSPAESEANEDASTALATSSAAAESTSSATAPVGREVVAPSEDPDSPSTEPDERALTVRVVDVDGRPIDGVPIYADWEPENERARLHGECLRFSGGRDGGREKIYGEEPTGLATWKGDRLAPSEVRKAIDAGTFEGPLRVVPSIAGGETCALRIELVPWPHEPIELRLDATASRSMRPIRVEVVFADGRPAPHFPVGLCVTALNPDFGRAMGLGGAHLDEDTIVWTDEAGVAWLDRRELTKMNAGLALAAVPGAEFLGHAAAAAPFYVAVRVPFDDDIDPNEGVRLELPPVGRLVGVVADPRGAEPVPLDEDASYRYRLDIEPLLPAPTEPLIDDYSGSSSEARFEIGWCGVGMRLDGHVSVTDGSYPAARLQAAGPTRDGEVVELRFELGEPCPLLAVPILGEDGAPLADTEIATYRRRIAPSRSETYRRERRWRTERTNETGEYVTRWSRQIDEPHVLEVQVGQGDARRWGRLELRPGLTETLTVLDTDASGRQRLAAPALRLGTEPLGELPIHVTPILASGEVRDEAGQPLERARVMSHGADEANGYFSSTWFWTGADGRFELEQQTAAPYRLSVVRDRYETVQSDVLQPGARGLVFTLRSKEPEPAAASLRGRVTGVPVIEGDRLVLEVRGEESKRELVVDTGGRIEGYRLRPGKARLHARTEGLDLEVLRVEDLELLPGEEFTDERLDPLDLSGQLRVVELRFEPTDGSLFAHAWVYATPEGLPRRKLRMGAQDRRELLVPTALRELRLEAMGYHPIVVDVSSSPVRVALQPVR